MSVFTVTRKAGEAVRRSMEVGDADGMGLRIAARQMDDGAIDYIMGFDERAPGDLVIATGGIEVLIAETERALLDGTTLDYVELEPGVYNFIFMNPNDPHYQPPSEA